MFNPFDDVQITVYYPLQVLYNVNLTVSTTLDGAGLSYELKAQTYCFNDKTIAELFFVKTLICQW